KDVACHAARFCLAQLALLVVVVVVVVVLAALRVGVVVRLFITAGRFLALTRFRVFGVGPHLCCPCCFRSFFAGVGLLSDCSFLLFRLARLLAADGGKTIISRLGGSFCSCS
ncbi:unnamed protein product, partial [Ectocarpus sp. 12 AP-2014]